MDAEMLGSFISLLIIVFILGGFCYFFITIPFENEKSFIEQNVCLANDYQEIRYIDGQPACIKQDVEKGFIAHMVSCEHSKFQPIKNCILLKEIVVIMD